MPAPNTSDLVDAFTRQVSSHLDPSKLEGPVRLDNTHTVVIIPVKGKGPIHAQVQGGINEQGVQSVINQLRAVPSLQGLIKPS